MRVGSTILGLAAAVLVTCSLVVPANAFCKEACRNLCRQFAARQGMTVKECIYVWARINKRYGPGSSNIARNWTRAACKLKCEATYKRHGYTSVKQCEAMVPCSQFPDL